MTEREKRTITLFSQYGALSKKELAEREGVSWATAVKQVTNLENAGILTCIGSELQPEVTGKNPLLYDLSDRHPLAIGLDLSSSTTTILLTNLKNTILHQANRPTIKHPTLSQLQNFVITTCLDFAHQYLTDEDMLQGIGISLPPGLVQDDQHTMLPHLRKALGTALHTQVQIESNVRCYTLYQKWAGKAFSLDDFLLVLIQDTIGTGIFCQGKLLRGAHGLAGEIGHLSILGTGSLCRCGKRGCLETLINQDMLYQQHAQQILQSSVPLASSPGDAEIHEGLITLFSLAKQGQPQASALVQQAARYLGVAVTALLLILDIPHILIAADFGPDGDALLSALRQEVQRHAMAGNDYTIAYYPLDQIGFARGAALLMLQDYFTKL
ncbi:ROK family protein [Candidatus Vecturithrix granuli]|uniref:ROK family protein n=1 Tax=Vecturithrix granuli TaxID=1499967 RepID=A0A081C7G7_VECG1|nr:ROK family protein [Candidatus Vecturithrix granuli]